MLGRRTLASAALLAGLPFAAAPALAQPDRRNPWMVLPPMPDLPPARVAGRVPVNDIEMWRAEFGPAEGRPVVVLHGGLASSNYFGKVIPDFVAEGFRVVCLDSRGHGRSTRSAQPYSYELMASDVVAMMDALRLPRADIVGWSDGAIIGLVMAIHQPARLRRVFAFGANTVPSGLVPNFEKTPVFGRFVARSEAEYKALSPTPDQYDSFVRQISHMWETQPNISDAQLQAIRTQITVADGRYDEAIRQSHSRTMAATIPDARLVILPGVSHFAMLQNPPLFARAGLDALTADWDS
ncbi:Alpha/beta hydrolase [Rhodovastum atsumiense]|uniref:Alpha/beta hydrolase n=1 Tax=Rhodovastum atsumiense TaxID=504468 RepID=A0A5M6IYW3_9PROT|nr:alpha/beta hydrolase [Rhodovastum atsumiense]KAA5613522.1 alpha/beta hydrolase [Rhodovastum atsumiense]CAH2603271.1 Alpha/beta hydrolase [Rhodovastum atsumiense]